MCERMICTLCKNDLLHATIEYSPSGVMPEWVADFSWQAYKPSFNIAPHSVTPVLVREHFIRNVDDDNNVICPMEWGLLPSWYKSGCKEFTVSSHNCRSETVCKKVTFKSAVSANKRCVVLADGFYDWMPVEPGGQTPCFIYFRSPKGRNMRDRVWTNNQDRYIGARGEWTGSRVMTIAGIFDMCRSTAAGVVYSYSILTTESSDIMKPFNDRMPLILDGVEKVRMWLDYENVGFRKAINHVNATENLELYPVNPLVNDPRFDCVECVKPFNPRQIRRNTVVVSPGQSRSTAELNEPSSSGWAPKKPRLDSDQQPSCSK